MMLDIKDTKTLPVMEEFYSLQGEGFQTGKAAYFLRIGGCDVGCYFCDSKEAWNPEFHKPTPVEDIVRRIVENPSKSVVVTGGEPLQENLDYLCSRLKEHHIKTYLETSGSAPLSGIWDWVCLSPKQNMAAKEEFFLIANELKIVVCSTDDFVVAEQYAKKVSENCILFLQPEWSQRKKLEQPIVDYILLHPKWRISQQTHKYINIP